MQRSLLQTEEELTLFLVMAKTSKIRFYKLPAAANVFLGLK